MRFSTIATTAFPSALALLVCREEASGNANDSVVFHCPQTMKFTTVAEGKDAAGWPGREGDVPWEARIPHAAEIEPFPGTSILQCNYPGIGSHLYGFGRNIPADHPYCTVTGPGEFTCYAKNPVH
jgi:hypothetical protein